MPVGTRPVQRSARRTWPRRNGNFQSGAGDGNRTHVRSLGSSCSTIELHPRNSRSRHRHLPARRRRIHSNKFASVVIPRARAPAVVFSVTRRARDIVANPWVNAARRFRAVTRRAILDGTSSVCLSVAVLPGHGRCAGSTRGMFGPGCFRDAAGHRPVAVFCGGGG